MLDHSFFPEEIDFTGSIKRKDFGTRSYAVYQEGSTRQDKNKGLKYFYYPYMNVSHFMGDDGIKRAIQWPCTDEGVVNIGKGQAICQEIVNEKEAISFYKTLSIEETVSLAHNYYPRDKDFLWIISQCYHHEIERSFEGSDSDRYKAYSNWMHEISDPVVRAYMNNKSGNDLKKAADMEYQHQIAESM